MIRWFMPWWWKYLFKNSTGWINVICRMRGHPNGYEFYTSDPEATEPDYHCKDCGELIW